MPSKKDLTKTFELSKYYNKWVATASFKDRRIVACGETPEEALIGAKDKGYEDPVASYFLKPDEPFYSRIFN